MFLFAEAESEPQRRVHGLNLLGSEVGDDVAEIEIVVNTAKAKDWLGALTKRGDGLAARTHGDDERDAVEQILLDPCSNVGRPVVRPTALRQPDPGVRSRNPADHPPGSRHAARCTAGLGDETP